MVGEREFRGPTQGLPPTIGPYLVQRELGRGGMGVVYLGLDLRMNRQVAIKRLLNPGPRLLQRFQREAELGGRLRHPGIAQVYEAVPHGPDAPYLVFEFVPGTPLIDLCRGGPLNGRRVAQVLSHICSAIAVAHEEGVLHRDLKPHNIMIRDGDLPVVLDFGLAKELDGEGGDLTRSGQALGTVAYASPEQLAGRKDEVDRLTDVYGLGAVLYHCLAGQPPFSGVSQINAITAVLTKPPPLEPLAGSHRDLVTICLKCLEKRPGDRYPSVTALGEELQRFLDGEPIEARPVPALTRLGRRLWRRKRLLLAGALLLLGVTGGLLYGSVDRAHQSQRRETAELSARKVEQAAGLLQRLEELRQDRYQPLRDDLAEEQALIDGARKEIRAILSKLEALTAEDPRPAQVFLYQGWAHLALLDLDPADACAQATLDQDPTIGRAHLLRGRITALRLVIGSMGDEDSHLLRAQRAKDAAASFRRASDLGESIGAREAAWLAVAQGDRAEILKQVAEIPPHRAAEERQILLALAQMPLGKTLKRAEQRAARKHLTRALEACPRSLEALVLSALLWMRTGEAPPALRELNRALLLKPDHPRLLRFRAEVQYTLGQDRAGLADIERALAVDPDDAIAYCTRGLLRQHLELPGGLADCDEAVRRAPGSYKAMVTRATLKRLQKDYAGALADLDSLVEVEGDTQVEIARAEVYLAKGDLRAAYRELSTVIKIMPFGMVHSLRGRVALKLGRVRQAARDYERAVELGPVRVADLLVLAKVRSSLNDAAGATRAIERALKIEPKNAELLCARGKLRAQAGDMRRAGEDLDRSIRIAPSAEAHSTRAALRRVAGDAQGALDDLGKALRLDPKHIQARLNRGIVLGQQGRPTEARADFDAAIAIDSTCAAAYAHRGSLRLGQQDLKGALADLENAVRLGEASRMVFFVRGQVYALLGRERDAALDWERGLGIKDGTAQESPGMRPYIKKSLGRPSRH